MKLVVMSVDDIKRYENNPRDNDSAVDAVAKSLHEFGWKQPIVVDSDNTIIVGHTRYKAALSLGMTSVPVVVADDLTPEQARAYRIADNKTGEIADFDDELLEIEVRRLMDDDYDISQLGFNSDELEKLLGQFDVSPTQAPELPDGDRSPYQQMTFTLHDSQADVVKEAIKKAIDAGGFDEAVNTNSNGNALARIAEAYLG